MELAASTFALLAGGGAAAAGTAGTAALGASSIGGGLASAAAATTGAAAASSGVLSAVQSAVTVGSMVATALGGYAGYQSHKTQAAFAEIDAGNEQVAAAAQANKIQRELIKRIGDARVAYAGSGLDISSGSDIEASLRSQADYETSIAYGGGNMRAAGRRAQVGSLLTQSTGSLISAAGKIADRGLDTYLDVSRRR